MIRVAVLDDQPAVLAGLTAVMRAEPGLVPVGVASDEAQLWPLLARTRPDIVIADDHLHGTEGLRLCRRIAADASAPKVVLHVAHPDPLFGIKARLAGVAGIADRLAPPEELFELLRRVARGERVLPDIETEHVRAAAGRLTDADLPLFSLLLAETAPRDICDALAIAPRELGWRTDRMLARLRAEQPAAA